MQYPQHTVVGAAGEGRVGHIQAGDRGGERRARPRSRSGPRCSRFGRSEPPASAGRRAPARSPRSPPPRVIGQRRIAGPVLGHEPERPGRSSIPPSSPPRSRTSPREAPSRDPLREIGRPGGAGSLRSPPRQRIPFHLVTKTLPSSVVRRPRGRRATARHDLTSATQSKWLRAEGERLPRPGLPPSRR